MSSTGSTVTICVGGGPRPAPQGRFNAGQKINAAITAGLTLLFLCSGVLLWLGERDTRFRFASTVILHDGLMYISLGLLVGHSTVRTSTPRPVTPYGG